MDKTRLYDATGRPIPDRGSSRGRFRRRLAALTRLWRRRPRTVGLVAALVTTAVTVLTFLTPIGRGLFESITGSPWHGPRLMSERLTQEDDASGHHLTFTLTNPNPRYAVLERMWLEVEKYENWEFFELPTCGLVAISIPPLGAVSGPVETHKDKVILGAEAKEYPVFEALGRQVFPSGETQDFVLDVRTISGARYRYRIFQEWHMPDGDLHFTTSSNSYALEYRRIQPASQTAEMISGVHELIVVLPMSELSHMFNPETQRPGLLFFPMEMIWGPWAGTEDLVELYGFHVYLRPFVQNLACLAALDRTSTGVQIRVLLPGRAQGPGLPIDRKRKVFIMDHERMLLEVDEAGVDQRVATLIEAPSQVAEFLETLLIPSSFPESGRLPTSPWHEFRFENVNGRSLRFLGFYSPRYGWEDSPIPEISGRVVYEGPKG